MNRRKILDRVEEQMPLIQSVITHQLNRTASVLLEKFRRILLRRFRGCHNAFGTHGTCLSRPYLPNNSSRSLFSRYSPGRSFRFHVHVASIVPESDHWPGEIVFVAQGAKARRAEHEVSAVGRRLQAKPPGGQHPDEMAAGEKQYVSLNRS